MAHPQSVDFLLRQAGRARHAAAVLAACGRRAVERLPSDCPLCAGRAHGGLLCPGCEADVVGSMRAPATRRCRRCALPLADPPGSAGAVGACADCVRRPPAYSRTVAGFDYVPPADLLVLQLKNGRRYGRARLLSALLAGSLRAAFDALPPDTVLVPVPASRASLRMRGFNPAGELARWLAADLGLPLRPRWLVRARESAKQSTLGRAARLRGRQGVFACPLDLPPCAVALVDDVMTTGGTLDAAARALRGRGAREVIALVAARVPPPARHAAAPERGLAQ